MKIAIIHIGEHDFVARLMNVFMGDQYNIETFEPTSDNFSRITEEISDFDPDVVILHHNFVGFTGENLVVDSLSYDTDICIGISDDSSQKDYCLFRISPDSNLEDLGVRQSILNAVHSAAGV